MKKRSKMRVALNYSWVALEMMATSHSMSQVNHILFDSRTTDQFTFTQALLRLPVRELKPSLAILSLQTLVFPITASRSQHQW